MAYKKPHNVIAPSWGRHQKAWAVLFYFNNLTYLGVKLIKTKFLKCLKKACVCIDVGLLAALIFFFSKHINFWRLFLEIFEEPETEVVSLCSFQVLHMKPILLDT